GLEAQRLAELERFPVPFVILGKLLHAERDWSDGILAALVEDGLDLLRRRVRRCMFAVELDEMEPELLSSLESALAIELAERIALNAECEAAKVFVRVGSPALPSEARPGRGSGEPAVQKPPSRHPFEQ